MLGADTEFLKWVAGIFVVVIGGAGARNFVSKKQAENAQDGATIAKANASKGIYETQVESLEDDRDRWRKTAEDGFKRISQLELRVAKMERDMRHGKSEFALRLKLFQRQNPTVDTSYLEDSAPTPLDVTTNPPSDFGTM